jgi:hypothetical protein
MQFADQYSVFAVDLTAVNVLNDTGTTWLEITAEHKKREKLV